MGDVTGAVADGGCKQCRVSPVEWVCLAAGWFFTLWYAWLMDDAYVYFRYVDNAVIHGQGLVFNAGEYVEGFSSPAWTILLLILRSLGANYWTAVLGIGLVCYTAFWAFGVAANRRLSPPAPSAPAINFPLIWLTMTYGVMCYFTSGLETPLVLVLAAAYAAFLSGSQSKPLQVLLALSPLVRPELLTALAVAVVWAWIRRRRIPRVMIVSCVLTLGAYMAFRIIYYADLFPNTFYLKNEFWPLQGFQYLMDTLMPYNTLVVGFVLAMAYVVLSRRHDRIALGVYARAGMILAALPVLFYVIKVGGDARHFRFLAFPYCLMAFAAGGIVEWILLPGTVRRSVSYLATAGIAVCLASFYPDQLVRHPAFRDHSPQFHREVGLINDAAYHRFHSSGVTPETLRPAPQLSVAAAKERYAAQRDTGELFRLGWCLNAYQLPGCAVVQMFGLTDAFLARTRMPSVRPAHKFGLFPLSQDVAVIRRAFGFRKGAFRMAIADGYPSEWIAKNLDTIELIEKKAFNKHNIGENIALAFTRVPQIVPVAGLAGGVQEMDANGMPAE